MDRISDIGQAIKIKFHVKVNNFPGEKKQDISHEFKTEFKKLLQIILHGIKKSIF